MASESPETDSAQQETAWADGMGYGAAQEGQQSSLENTSQQTDETNDPSALDAVGDAPSADGNPDDADAGEYDPESVTVAPSVSHVPEHAALKPSPHPPSKKPKTAGGFLVGDSDSEDESSTPASESHPPEIAQKGHSVSRSPLHASTPAQEEQGTPGYAPPEQGDDPAPSTSSHVIPANPAGAPPALSLIHI